MPFPLDVKYIVEAEQELGVIFPVHFKAKMIQENGGSLATKDDYWHLYPFLDKSDHKRISRTCNHIGLETRQARNWRNFPRRCNSYRLQRQWRPSSAIANESA